MESRINKTIKLMPPFKELFEVIDERLSNIEKQIFYIQETIDSLFVSPEFQDDLILKGKGLKEDEK